MRIHAKCFFLLFLLNVNNVYIYSQGIIIGKGISQFTKFLGRAFAKGELRVSESMLLKEITPQFEKEFYLATKEEQEVILSKLPLKYREIVEKRLRNSTFKEIVSPHSSWPSQEYFKNLKEAINRYRKDQLWIENIHKRDHDMLWNNKFSQSVLLLQKKLNKTSNYNLIEDGIFGKNTEKALCDFSNKSKVKFAFINKPIHEVKGLFEFQQLVYTDLFKNTPDCTWEFDFQKESKKISGFISSNFSIKSKKNYDLFNLFYNSFFQKLEIVEQENSFDNVLFLLINEINSQKYLTALRKISKGEFLGESYELSLKDNSTASQILENTIYKSDMDKKIIVFGDVLPDYGEKIMEIASKNKMPIICRKTTTNLSLNLINDALIQFDNKKLDFSNLSILNGIPSNEEQATCQNFPTNGLSVLQELRDKINIEIQNKIKIDSEASIKLIPNKKSLIDELTNGNNDVLIFFAHSDEKSIYFGNEKITIEELESLPIRVNRKQNRVAVLFSCSAANIFNKDKKWYEFFKKINKSFAEILIEKRFFDLVIAPSSTINGEEILKMIQELDQCDILEIRNRIHKLVNDSEIFNLADK